MNIKRKVLSIFLCVMLLCNLAIVSASAEMPTSITYDRESYVTVTGNVPAKNAGYDATLMLVRKGADLNNLKKGDIGYIVQEEIGADGKYLFEFSFSDFTYSQGAVDNYEVVLNVNGERMTPSISKAAVITELVSFDIDISNFGKSITNIINPLGLKELKYKYILYIGFYDESGKLLNVKRFKNSGDGSNVSYYGYKDVPAGTSYAKGFLWDSDERMIPLAPSEEQTVGNKPLKVLMIGNSLTVDATRWLTKLTKEGGLNLQYKTKVFAAATIAEHAANLEAELGGRTAAEAEKGNRTSYGSSANYAINYNDDCLLSTPFKNERFDLIVIQAYDSDGGGFIESDFSKLGTLVSQIRSLQPEAEIVIYEPWLFWNGNKESRDSQYTEKYANIINPVKASIPTQFENITPKNRPLGSIPVAQAFHAAYDEDEVFAAIYPSGDDDLGNLTLEWSDSEELVYATGLYRDFAHASYYGCYLTHAVWYEFLTGEKAPTTDKNGDALVEKPDAVDDAEHIRRLELLSDVAHKVMSDKNTLEDLF